MLVDLDAEVRANLRLADDYNVVELVAPEIARATQPGQFVMVRPGRGLDPLLRRPFSIFEILRDEHDAPVGVSLLNKRVGVSTRRLFELRQGDRVGCLGPLGRPFSCVDPPAEAWLVAGGVGLAPFATLAEALRQRGTPTTLFYGARTAAELYALDLFSRLGARLVLATEDGTRGTRGLVTAPLENALVDPSAPRTLALFACGPTAMMRAVADLARRHERRIEVSLEQVMGCGLGGCYSCVVRVRRPDAPNHYVRSCLAGPVFDGTAIVWDELQH